jgi:hypothetical protein
MKGAKIFHDPADPDGAQNGGGVTNKRHPVKFRGEVVKGISIRQDRSGIARICYDGMFQDSGFGAVDGTVRKFVDDQADIYMWPACECGHLTLKWHHFFLGRFACASCEKLRPPASEVPMIEIVWSAPKAE